MKYLDKINSPADLKQLPVSSLPDVCSELRAFIIDELSHNPGHLGSSLGAIELTVALHYVFDTPDDRIVWDVGHQAYAHKILTGRRERFHTNRQFKGLAPFPTPLESEYDTCVCGHASNSISAALGMDVGEKVVSGQKSVVSGKHVVAVIGDGAMTGGLAFEGLNNTSMRKNDLLIVLNDNNMAIDPLKGGFTQYLLDITTSSFYNRWRWRLYRLAVRLHLMDETKRQQVMRRHNNLKSILTKQPNNIFQAMNIRYFGPADGHDVVDLVRILREIKNHKGPKVLHIITKKGKGPRKLRRLGEDPPEEGNGAGKVQLPPVKEKVEAGLAAHGAEVEDGVLLRGVPEEGGDEVLHGVHFRVAQEVAGVGPFEAEVQRDGVAVLPGEVEAGGQDRVVHGEAGDAFHVIPPPPGAGRRGGPPGPGSPAPDRSQSTPPPAVPRRDGRRRISGRQSGCRSGGRPGRWHRPPSP